MWKDASGLGRDGGKENRKSNGFWCKEGQDRSKDLQVGMMEVSGGRQGGRRWMGADGPGASS